MVRSPSWGSEWLCSNGDSCSLATQQWLLWASVSPSIRGNEPDEIKGSQVVVGAISSLQACFNVFNFSNKLATFNDLECSAFFFWREAVMEAPMRGRWVGPQIHFSFQLD